MIVDDRQQTLTAFRCIRSVIQRDLDHYLSGEWFSGEIRDGKRCDTSEQTIAELERRLADIHAILASFEEHPGA